MSGCYVSIDDDGDEWVEWSILDDRCRFGLGGGGWYIAAGCEYTVALGNAVIDSGEGPPTSAVVSFVGSVAADYMAEAYRPEGVP